jgi:cytidylate kinase
MLQHWDEFTWSAQMPVILISRGTMSGVHLLLDCLKARTGIRCYSREDLEEIVNHHGKLAKRVLEKLANATSAYDQFSDLRWPYLVLMRKAMLEEICKDNVVYHGYSAQFLLPVIRHFVRVRIDAPLDMRMQMTMNRLKCSEAAAREYISDADQHRIKWARFMFGKDIRDTLQYDININMGHMTLSAACGILESIMGENDFQASPESQEMVNRLLIESDIEVALVTDPRTEAYEIFAKIDEKGAQLIGPYLEDSELETVLQVARRVPGFMELQYTPGYAPGFGIGV